MREHPITQWLFDMAVERFRHFGPHDERGAAFWDAAAALAEGRVPDRVKEKS